MRIWEQTIYWLNQNSGYFIYNVFPKLINTFNEKSIDKIDGIRTYVLANAIKDSLPLKNKLVDNGFMNDIITSKEKFNSFLKLSKQYNEHEFFIGLMFGKFLKVAVLEANDVVDLTKGMESNKYVLDSIREFLEKKGLALKEINEYIERLFIN